MYKKKQLDLMGFAFKESLWGTQDIQIVDINFK